MKTLLSIFILVALPVLSLAAGHTDSEPARVSIDVSDKAAMQDGAQTFVTYCMGCHSARFQRYERIADDLGIPHDVMLNKLMPAGARLGDHMVSAMRPADARRWLGVAPPDLTLVARVRGTDWLYDYLRSFYEDSGRPWGVNNAVFPNVAMPNVLAGLQGRQVVDCGPGQPHVPLSGSPVLRDGCGRLTILPGTGSLSEGQFNDKVKNLVTFLAYSANPDKLQHQRIGTYVLLYLAILFTFAYLLKREYWKDVR